MEQFLFTLSLIMIFSCFIKIFTAFSIFRFGLGLNSSGLGLVFLIISLVLTIFVMESNQVFSIESFSTPLSVNQAFDKAQPFMEKNTNPKILEQVDQIRVNLNPALRDRTKGSYLLAFTISELSAAFELGLLLIIPFIVIDLLVSNILLALGVTQISSIVIALPLKILLFISVDGWQLLIDKLIKTYIL